VPERIRVLLLIPRLRAGGAEQVMAQLAGSLSREKHEVHLGLVTAAAAPAPLPPWVTVHALAARRARFAAIPLLKLVWRLRPAVVLSGAPEISFMVLLLRHFFPRHTAVVVRQNGTVSSALAMGGLPRYTRLLYRLLYRRADKIVCQSRSMAADLAREINLDPERIEVLPNPIDIAGIRAALNGNSLWRGVGPHLLAVGRLSPEKGFDLLLRALAAVREHFPTADLTIAGEGRDELDLKRLCRDLQLQSAVQFAGRIDKPYAYFPGCTLFVLSSRHEGMPNALLEAAAAGLPIVATPACGGVVDLLRGRPGAWLASESTAQYLADALIAALRELLPGQRFDHAFFPAQANRSEQQSSLPARSTDGNLVTCGVTKECHTNCDCEP